ncbi:MAG: glycerol-3-phosphate 1-O-acyltransferase PlsY [Eubacteriales bacterium]
MPSSITLILASIFCYFLGNISPSIILGKLIAKKDIRTLGSGNAGTTNVLRTMGKVPAAITLIVDIAKGAVAVIVGNYFGGQDLAMLCGLAAFIGHIWPALYGFKGGKGIATAAGVIITLEPLMGLIVAVIGVGVIAVSKRVSIGAMVAAVSLPIVSYFFDPKYVIWSCIMAIIIFIRHRENIKRLIKGEEPKLNFKLK